MKGLIGLILFLIFLAVLLVVFPLPMRCGITQEPTSQVVVDVVIHSPGQEDCFPFWHRKFWKEAGWNVKFIKWMNHKQDILIHP